MCNIPDKNTVYLLDNLGFSNSCTKKDDKYICNNTNRNVSCRYRIVVLLKPNKPGLNCEIILMLLLCTYMYTEINC